MSIRDVDSHKLMYHPNRVSEWLNEGKCAPLHVEIGLTNACNHKCKFCTLDWITHGKDFIDKDIMIEAIDDMYVLGVKSIYFAGEGEPLLHKDAPIFIKLASKKGLKVSLSTNGDKLTKDLSKNILPYLSWIRFSLDAVEQDTHTQLHGISGRLERILKNIKDAVELKKELNLDIDIGVQFILMPENINEIINGAKLMKKIGVDNFQVKPCHDHPESSHSPVIFKYSHDYLEKKLMSLETNKFQVIVRTKSMERLQQPRNYKECFGFQFYSLIDAKGNVVPCNVFYKRPEYIFGNLYDLSFKTIWNSDYRQEVIKKISETNHKMCGEYRCRFDVINRYLHRIKYPERNDEFI